MGCPANGDQVVKGDQWLHVTKIDNAPTSGWMAIVHKGVTIANIQGNSSSPLPPPPPNMVPVKILKAVVTYSENGVIKTEVLVPE